MSKALVEDEEEGGNRGPHPRESDPAPAQMLAYPTLVPMSSNR